MYRWVVSGQLHASAALLPGKEHHFPLDRRLILLRGLRSLASQVNVGFLQKLQVRCSIHKSLPLNWFAVPHASPVVHASHCCNGGCIAQQVQCCTDEIIPKLKSGHQHQSRGDLNPLFPDDKERG
jgi:hypothetical protein